MQYSVCVCVSLLVRFSAALNEPSRVVNTVQGPVRGYKHPDGDFYAFYSIPYATAPTGTHKFKAPLPPPTWVEIFEAVDKQIICPQHPFLFQIFPTALEFTMEENCLVANVFVPDIEETNLSVVVYVHGGGFQSGLGDFVLHTALMNSGKVIVVNFNYRLGPHGFLCLGTEDVPGNAGMKDQVAALRWVKRNIASFGGNPDDVTVAGYSAGAAAVELLLVSPSTRGLFNKVIPESGSGVAVWAVQRDPLDIAKSYARALGFVNDDDVYSLEEFFKNLSIDTLQSSYSFMDRRDSTVYFAPCVERKEAKDPFLIDDPVNTFKNGKYETLPILTGFADMEGIMKLSLFDQWKDDMNEHFHDFLPADLHFVNDDERVKVAQEIKEVYFGQSSISTETVLGYVNYFSDVMFVYPAYRSVSLQAAAGSNSLYLYVYAFRDNSSSTPYPDVTGADHCDQTKLLAGQSSLIVMDTETDDLLKMRRLLTDVWTNFIITGNPTPLGSLAAEVLGEWRPTSAARPQHALFNATSELRGALWPARMALWDRVYSQYYRAPVPPPSQPRMSKTELKPTPEGSLAAKAFGGEWRPTSAARPQHALFNATSELRGALWPARMALWDDVYSKYYFTPIPPPEPPKKPKSEL